jgi:hypothetical protein
MYPRRYCCAAGVFYNQQVEGIMGKKDIGVFGDANYLVNKFDDIDKAVVSEKSAMAKLIKATVNGLSTKKDNMHVYRVLRTTGTVDGKSCKGYVAHIAMGLNGPGRQEDYLAAMRRLVMCKTVKMRIFVTWIDATDDLVDVLVDCADAADTLKKEPAK